MNWESRRSRWIVLVAGWAIVAALLWPHMIAVRDHLSYVSTLALRGKPEATTPFKMPYPDGDVDAQEWVQHAYDLLNGHSLRLRHTDIDNAPFGREVHWNSAWAWTIAGAGKIEQAVTDEPLTTALEQSTIWLNPLVLFLTIVLLSWYTSRWAGAVAGAGVAIAMIGHPSFYEGFAPAYVDHHGLLTASILGMTLGALFMGGGWWRDDDTVLLLPRSPEVARRAAIVSALCGAAGVWVSAASVIPAIALIGASGALAALALVRGAAQRGLQYDGGVWRIWGRVGGAAWLVFYLLEYFSSHLGMRLEVNHPLYALAWWGGGELIADITEAWFGVRRGRLIDARTIGSVVLVLSPVIAIVIGGGKVFTPHDPLISYLYNAFLIDYSPIWNLAAFSDLNPYRSVIGIVNLPLIAGLAVLAARRRRAPPALWLATVATFLFTAMGWWENRWVLNAAGPQIALALVLLMYFTARYAPAKRFALMLAGFAVLFVPSAVLRTIDARAINRNNDFSSFDAEMMMYRDIASTLRATQPEGDITLLASENVSLSVGYYGRIKTVGTSYWENVDGLKASADIFAAQTPEQAKALIIARKITHIAVITSDDVTSLFFNWLHPNSTEEEFDACFGHQLMDVRTLPPWLELVPYTFPEDLGAHVGKVLLFKVVLNEAPFQPRTNTAFAELRTGEVKEAERDFTALIAQDSGAFAPRLGISDVLFARHDWKGGTDAALGAIARAPRAMRIPLYGQTAGNLLRADQTSAAIRLYHAALNQQFDPDIAYALAFFLATSRDDSIRNGAEALSLAQRAVKANPESPQYLACLAAALAEMRRFPEAVAAAEHALSAAEARHDPAIAEVATQMLTAFRVNQPWRE